jgi:phosphatidylinositol 4-kinase
MSNLHLKVCQSRVRAVSPYGHLANWKCASVIVKIGSDLRQEQLAIHLIKEFSRIWFEERCQCFVRPFHVLITGPNSGLVETIVDAVSVHSIKKAMYARRISTDGIMRATLLDHFITVFNLKIMFDLPSYLIGTDVW